MPDDYYVSQYSGEEIDDAIARALPGGAIDITLQNNDPKKWGLGIVLANTQGAVITDFDEILPTGFYYVQSGSLNRPIHGAVYAVVINRSYDDVTVFAESPDGVIARRKYKESWGVWEYLNPPMMSNTNTEYRTTERYLGKPVYVKAIDFGALPNATTKSVSHSASNVDVCIRATGSLTSGDKRSIPFADSNGRADIFGDSGQVTIKTDYNYSSLSAYATIWYTKTTD